MAGPDIGWPAGPFASVELGRGVPGEWPSASLSSISRPGGKCLQTPRKHPAQVVTTSATGAKSDCDCHTDKNHD